MSTPREHDDIDRRFQERLHEVLAETIQRADDGRAPDRERLLAEHPELAGELAGWLADEDRMREATASLAPLAGGRPAPASAPPGAGSRASGESGGATAGAALDPDELPVGSLLGQYRLEEVVGRGGMGVVYKAHHLHLGRTVAIKLLAQRFGRDPDLVRRFQREARALARLEHPHIVRIFDLGTHGEMHYFVMEHVDGVDLRRLMATGDLDPARALALVQKVCAALEFAHEQGIVHRDIKPENILVDRAGEPKIADFGLARVVRDDTVLGQLTRTDVVMGTYNYMAPEQKTSAAVDHRADIYALGVVLYEMLTGRLPIGRFELPSDSAGVDGGIDRVVLKALENEPARRYQSARQMGADVTTVIEGGPGADAAAPRVLEVRTTGRETVLAKLEAGWLRLRMDDGADEDLVVRTWTHPHVGVERDDEPEGALASRQVPPPPGSDDFDQHFAGTGLELVLPDDETTVFVPPGLPVEVVSDESDVDVVGMAAAVRVTSAEGDVNVRDHHAPLRAAMRDDGDILVEGLHSRDFDLEALDGSITVTGLHHEAGRGRIHSDGGGIRVGVAGSSADFSYEAQAFTGTVEGRLGEVTTATEQLVQGSCGHGRGRLVIHSNKGAVKLLPHHELVRELFLEEMGQSILCGLVVFAALYWWFQMKIVAWIVAAVWTYRILRKVVGRMKVFRANHEE